MNHTEFLHRKLQHSSFIAPPDQITCHRPPEFSQTTDEECNYVSFSEGCTSELQIFNYLKIVVCILHFENNSFGVVKMTIFTLIVLLFFLFLEYLITSSFLVPNCLTIHHATNLNDFNFGFIVISAFIIAPDLIGILGTCNVSKSPGTAVIADSFGKIMGFFVAGVITMAIYHKYDFEPKLLICNLIIIGVGVISTIELIYNEMINAFMRSSELHEFSHLDMKIYSAVSGVVIIGYSIFLIVTQEPVESEETISDIYKPQNDASSTESSDKYERSTNKKIKKLSNTFALKHALNPFNHLKFPSALILLMVPLWLLLAIIIPVVDENRPLHGWCKPIAIMSIIFVPITFKLIAISDYTFIFLLFIGLILAGLTFFLTHPRRVPSTLHLFAIIGMFVACTFYGVIDYEIQTLVWQILNYTNEWKTDAVVLLFYHIGQIAVEYIFCKNLIRRGYPDMAYGVVMGLTIYLTYLMFPTLFLMGCPFEKQTLLISAHTETAYFFFLLIISGFVLGIFLTDFKLRHSHGYYVFVVYLFFYMYVTLCQNTILHPFGSHHSIREETERKISEWA